MDSVDSLDSLDVSASGLIDLPPRSFIGFLANLSPPKIKMCTPYCSIFFCWRWCRFSKLQDSQRDPFPSALSRMVMWHLLIPQRRPVGAFSWNKLWITHGNVKTNLVSRASAKLGGDYATSPLKIIKGIFSSTFLMYDWWIMVWNILNCTCHKYGSHNYFGAKLIDSFYF